MSLLGSHPIKQDFLSLLGHHVRQIGEGETLADPTLAVDRDDLGGLFRLRRNRIRLYRCFFTQQMGGRRGKFRGGQESLAEAHERCTPVQDHLETSRVVESDGVGGRRVRRGASMGQEAVKRKRSRFDQLHDPGEIAIAPDRRDPDAGFAHESRRKAEAQAIVESGEHNLAAGRESLHERIENRGVAADIEDRAVGLARIGVGRRDLVSDRASRPKAVGFPYDRRLASRGDDEPR